MGRHGSQRQPLSQSGGFERQDSRVARAGAAQPGPGQRSLTSRPCCATGSVERPLSEYTRYMRGAHRKEAAESMQPHRRVARGRQLAAHARSGCRRPCVSMAVETAPRQPPMRARWTERSARADEAEGLPESPRARKGNCAFTSSKCCAHHAALFSCGLAQLIVHE